jgi:hypothetical protein
MVLVVVVEGATVVVVVGAAVVVVVLEDGDGVVGGAGVEVVGDGATVVGDEVEDAVPSAMAVGVPKAPRPAMMSTAAIPAGTLRLARRIIPPGVGQRSASVSHTSPNGPSPRHETAI